MPVPLIFLSHLVLGYLAWGLVFFAYIGPKLRTLGRVGAQRAIATLHGFRFFGLVFILPGVVGHLPAGFAEPAAWGDFATGVLALLALVFVRIRPVFWLLVVALNLVGMADLVVDYADAVRLGLPGIAGELGAAYIVPVLYVPLLMITHLAAVFWLVRWTPVTAPIEKRA